MCNLSCFGQIVAVLGAAACGIGIADVVLTSQYYCNPSGANWCSASAEPYVWVWVAVGIWAGALIFLTGLYAICSGVDPSKFRIYSIFLFLSTFLLAPALAVLSSIEVWRGMAATYNFYTYGNGTFGPGNIMPANNPWQAKLALPLANAILGGILVLLLVYCAWLMCTKQPMGIGGGGGGGRGVVRVVNKPIVVQTRETKVEVVPPPTQNFVSPCPTVYNNPAPCGPCGATNAGFTVYKEGPRPYFMR